MSLVGARIGLLILGLGLVAPAFAEVPEPSDYRQDNFRADVPATLDMSPACESPVRMDTTMP